MNIATITQSSIATHVQGQIFGPPLVGYRKQPLDFVNDFAWLFGLYLA